MSSFTVRELREAIEGFHPDSPVAVIAENEERWRRVDRLIVGVAGGPPDEPNADPESVTCLRMSYSATKTPANYVLAEQLESVAVRLEAVAAKLEGSVP